MVKNLAWLTRNHQIWQSQFENEVEGEVMIASDTENGKLFIVGDHELLIYSVEDNSTQKIDNINKPQFPYSDYKAIYNSQDNNIYCYLVDFTPTYYLVIKTGEWNKIEATFNYKSEYLHHLSMDPDEDNNLFAAKPDLVNKLKKELDFLRKNNSRKTN